MAVFLSRRDWVYLLSLLVPFIAYNLGLKVYGVVSQPGGVGVAQALGLAWSAVFLNLGFALLWIGLFAAARRGLARRVVVVLFHASTVLVVVLVTCSHQYFREMGSTLDYGTIAEWIPKFDEILPILTQDISPAVYAVLAVALFYAVFGPTLISRAVERWRGWPPETPAATAAAPWLVPSGFCVLAAGFIALSLVTGTTSLARDPVVNVVLTGFEEATSTEASADPNTAKHPAIDATLAPAAGAEAGSEGRKNVVLIHLESTRALSVTPYNEDLNTMPFLDELSRDSSLLMENAYTTVPRSSKASVSVNCGVEPPLYPGPEFEPDGVPAQCLADLLAEQGYRTVFFASTYANMDNFGDVVDGFGYREFYPAELMNTEGYQVTNTFGFEEDVMLDPSEDWLRENGGEPFLAEYFTGTGHYGYECVPNRYGYEYFSENEELDRYHNCLRMLDFFLMNLFEQYQELGLYEDTIFVIFGDHGEGFGEHGRSLHGDTIHEEGLKVPLIIHDPGGGRFEGGERRTGLANQMDILPTVVEMLGYRVRNGEYPGYSLLRELPEDRTLMFSCITNRKCLASINGSEKYVYHYANEPEEIFDLSADPLEKNNLADGYSGEDLDRRREALLAWRSKVNSEYAASSSSGAASPK